MKGRKKGGGGCQGECPMGEKMDREIRKDLAHGIKES